jgi:hypothetical protein
VPAPFSWESLHAQAASNSVPRPADLAWGLLRLLTHARSTCPPWVPVVPPARPRLPQCCTLAGGCPSSPPPACSCFGPGLASCPVSQPSPNHTPNLLPLLLDPPPPPPSRSAQRHTIPFQRDPLLASRQHFRVDRIPRRTVPRFTFFQPAVQQPTAPRQRTRLPIQTRPDRTTPSIAASQAYSRFSLFSPATPTPSSYLLRITNATTLFRFTFFVPHDLFGGCLQSLESNLKTGDFFPRTSRAWTRSRPRSFLLTTTLPARNPPTPASTPSTPPR